MSSEELELAAEQAHLDATYASLDAALYALTARRAVTGINDFANDAIEAMRQERIRVYAEASGPLYFGRIDDASGRSLYIGRHAVYSPRNELLSINWRAPAAEPFYTATPRDPHGLVRRRRIDIEDRRVLGFVDESLAAGDQDHLTEAIFEDITRQRVGEMRQIISTITPEQYDLISEDVDGALVVQGGPGTGKTAVGLHRAAWLLYTRPELTRHGVLVIGPNETFIRYISQVLPSLGERSVDQRPIGALVSEAHREATESKDLASLKGGAVMAEVLNRLLWQRIKLPEEDVELTMGRGELTVTAAEVRALVLNSRERTLSFESGRQRFREQLANRIAGKLQERLGRSSMHTQDELVRVVRSAKGYQQLANRTWPRETPLRLFERLFRNGKHLKHVAGDLLTPDEVCLLLSVGAPQKRRDMTPTDVALLDEAHWLIDPFVRRFGHVVVDEAQNLTGMELRMAVRRARNQSLTILGDAAQRTADAGVSDWNRLLQEAGVRRYAIRELEISYRVPDEFLVLSSRLLPPGSRVPRGVRTAPWPPVAIRTSAGSIYRTLADLASRMATDLGSVGVVVPTSEWDRIGDALMSHGVDYADGIRGPLGPGINLVDLHVVKGLEFDAVIVVDPATILVDRPDGGIGGLYTALTRPTRALAVVHVADLPEQLDSSPTLVRLPRGDVGERWAELARAVDSVAPRP